MIFVSKKNGKYSGCYIEERKSGFVINEIPEEYLSSLNSFPNIMSLLNQGCILQIYREGVTSYAEIGTHNFEGPYAETEYLDICYSAHEDNFYSALLKLNDSIFEQSIDKNNSLKKAYRPYGQMIFK